MGEEMSIGPTELAHHPLELEKFGRHRLRFLKRVCDG